MRDTHTLTRHRDIQNWVATHKGTPAIVRERDSLGSLHARLALRFARARRTMTQTPDMDDGIMPCSWSAWLAELDRQQLALKVLDAEKPVFEFVERKTLN
jgi:hypothetical protein